MTVLTELTPGFESGDDGIDYSDHLMRRLLCQPESLQAARLRGEFNKIWERLVLNMQEPIRDDVNEFSGFSGHRIVTFDGRMGRAALSFQLYDYNGQSHRTIIAKRRKIYKNPELRRLNYASDELRIGASSTSGGTPDVAWQRRLGTIASWVDKFDTADPY